MRKDVARNREILLGTARNLLAQKGVGFTFNELAKEAKVGVGTVYRHFSNKEELFNLLLDEPLNEIVGIAKNGAQKTATVENFRATLLELCDFLNAHKAIAQVLFASEKGRAEEIQALMLRELGGIVAEISQLPQVRSDLSVTDLPFIFSYAGYVGALAGQENPELWRRYIDAAITGLLLEPSLPVPLALTTEELTQVMDRNQQKIVNFLQGS